MSNFVKFMLILKRQVSSSSIFVSFFIVMTHNSTINLKLLHFLFWTKGSYESSNFDTFECSGQNLQNSSCHFRSNKSVFLQFLHHSSVSMFLTLILSLLNIGPELKWRFLRLLSAWVKFCLPKNLYANFETTSRFLCKFCISFQFHKRLFLCAFLAQRIYTLLKRSPEKWKFLRLHVLGSNFVEFLMPILIRRVDFSPNFVSFFSFMKNYSSVLY